ncbi:hypothetical protein [Janibacter anophelis]|uniref:hypothetical protein n=1 Tax=Janibacter anophelis TaxID=319054 RepID=UPI0012ED1F88|nr:hypothetical protein [Janibacter anophelis]
MAAYVESLVDAAWDATSAHEVVLGRRRRGRSTAALGHHAVELAGRLGAAMALDLEGEAVITDPLDADPMLVDAVLTALGEGALVHVLVDGSSPVARAMRRFHWLRGRSVITVPPHDVLPIIVTRLPLAGAGSDPESILATADGVQLDMTESQRALILGPATALCDRLNDSSREQHRDHVVRLGRLRCAVRLPAGLVTDGSRQVVGIWVLAGAPSSRKLDEQRLAAADLTNETLRADVVDDLVTDVMASLSDRARATHNFRYARLTATAPLLASSGPLVAPGSRPTRARTAAVAESVVRVRGLIKQLQTQPPPSLLEGMAVAAGDGEDSRQQVTIEAAIRARELRVLAGTRIAEAVPQTDGGVRVIDAHTVQHPSPPRKGLDPLDLERSWPRARRTEPGDVIFCVSPHPAAIIDWDGLSVVASPARILRCAPGSGLVPEVVARAINALPARSPRWQAWSLPRIPAEQTGELAIALRRIADEEDQARQRLADLSALAHELAHGIARGAMTITPTEEGH